MTLAPPGGSAETSDGTALGPLRILYVTTHRYDFTTATLIQGLATLPGVELRTTTLGNYAAPSQVLDKSEALEYGRRAALLILGYNRGVDTNLFWSIQNPQAARVFVDGGDNGELAIPVEQLTTLDVVFKREYFLSDDSFRNLWKLLLRTPPGMWGRPRRHRLVPLPSFESFKNKTRPRDFVRNAAAIAARHKLCPFPYGIEDRFRGELNPEPTCELSCLLSCHLPERADFVTRLRSLDLPNAFIGEVPNEPEDVQRLIDLGAVNAATMRFVELGHNLRYYDRIRRSRRTISVPGGGFDTLRFWEILGAGSLLISKRIAIEMPHPPIEGKHYLAFDSFEELKDLLERSYRRRDEADEIRAKGHAFALRYHTSKARAVYFLSTLIERGLLTPIPLEDRTDRSEQ